ncbi:unnamed protein product [Phytomonas sp. Hart1]|nr:unnamed protein product [Phytomonas sp. Hart1]|eukprot:CCW69882.1 unnamed protein product [Phytomonas sp. isolate Hart1]
MAFEHARSHGRKGIEEVNFITERDLELVIRLCQKFTSWLNQIISPRDEFRGGSMKAAQYSQSDHYTIKLLAQNISTLWLLIAAFAAHAEIEVDPILRFFNAEEGWLASGLGPITHVSYCRALSTLIHVLLTIRRNDFNNTEVIAAQLVWGRLARRPKYRWEAFKLLYFAVKGFQDVPEHPDNAVFGQLLMMTCTMAAVEDCLALGNQTNAARIASGSRREAGVKNTRQALSHHLDEVMNESLIPSDGGSPMVSYFQLLVLATVRGMQTADLTDDDALRRRARITQLTDEPSVQDSPDVLRLLLACSYRMSTSEGLVQHDLLSFPSVIALQMGMNRYLFQSVGFELFCKEGANDPSAQTVNMLFSFQPLLSREWVELVISTTSELLRDATESGPLTTMSTTAEREMSPLPLKEGGSGMAMRDTLLEVLSRIIQTIYDANHAYHRAHADVMAGMFTPSTAGGPSHGLWEMTHAAVELLFLYFAKDELLLGADLLARLEDLARIYALRVSTPIRAAPSGPEARALPRIPHRLTWLTDQMKAQALQRVLTHRLVPLTADLGRRGGGGAYYRPAWWRPICVPWRTPSPPL